MYTIWESNFFFKSYPRDPIVDRPVLNLFLQQKRHVIHETIAAKHKKIPPTTPPIMPPVTGEEAP